MGLEGQRAHPSRILVWSTGLCAASAELLVLGTEQGLVPTCMAPCPVEEERWLRGLIGLGGIWLSPQRSPVSSAQIQNTGVPQETKPFPDLSLAIKWCQT